MTQYQITLSDEIVHGLFKEDGAMARLVEQVLNQVLEAEVTETLQAKPYERPLKEAYPFVMVDGDGAGVLDWRQRDLRQSE